jgi:hypothetical protein
VLLRCEQRWWPKQATDHIGMSGDHDFTQAIKKLRINVACVRPEAGNCYSAGAYKLSGKPRM